MQFALKTTRLGLRNSTTRLPFRYGTACLTSCPQATLEATIEIGGRLQSGFSGDCLPPSWFDKSPDKDFRQQIMDMLDVLEQSQRFFLAEAASPVSFFPLWLDANDELHRQAAVDGTTPLLASFGVSMMERALMDALARAAGVPLARAVRDNVFGIEAAAVHPELRGMAPADWLPERPQESIYVRHTVGLGDPLTASEIPDDERLSDGFPQSLEQYVQTTGTRYFKIKLSRDLDHDRQRLLAAAAIIQRTRDRDYAVTLDGNELFETERDFEALIGMLRGTPGLQTLWNNTLAIEQPLRRAVSLSKRHTRAIRELARHKPVIIDEADGHPDSFRSAIDVGYRGVSSKACKGAVKSLLNAGLAWHHNDGGRSNRYVITGEDLCSVGIVPMQSDLCLAATLGLAHVERNGHHYHPGLSYLPAEQQLAALAAHGDLYARQHGRVAPLLCDGRFCIESLQCPGFGFAVLPDWDNLQPAEQWQFESLETAR